MAQLTKVILQLRHGQSVPSIKATPLSTPISRSSTRRSMCKRRCSEWRPAADRGQWLRRAASGARGSPACGDQLLRRGRLQCPPHHRRICLRCRASQPRCDRSPEAPPHVAGVYRPKIPNGCGRLSRRMRDLLLATEAAPALVGSRLYAAGWARGRCHRGWRMVVRERQDLLRGLALFLERDRGPGGCDSIPCSTGHTEVDQGVGDLLASEAGAPGGPAPSATRRSWRATGRGAARSPGQAP